MRHITTCFAVLLFLGCKKEDGQVQMPPQKIPVITIQQQDVPVYDEFVGQIYGYKDIPIRARVDGVLEKISFEEGTRVEKGQVLYRINADPYMAEVAAKTSKVSEARTLQVNAMNDLNRYKPLAEMNAISQLDLDAAQATYDAAVASEKAAEANLLQAQIKLGYCTIEAPITGLIGKTEAREGEYVGRDPNPVILNTLSRIDSIRVQFSIAETKYLEAARMYLEVRNAENVSHNSQTNTDGADVELILSDGSIYEDKGTIDFVNNQINSSTGSLLVQASFPNSRNLLRPGLYAKVRLQMDIAKNALIVPVRCLIELQGKYSVMVVSADGVVESRAVEVGARQGDLAIITKGLSSNEMVVIDAIQKVATGQTVQPVPQEFKSKRAK